MNTFTSWLLSEYSPVIISPPKCNTRGQHSREINSKSCCSPTPGSSSPRAARGAGPGPPFVPCSFPTLVTRENLAAPPLPCLLPRQPAHPRGWDLSGNGILPATKQRLKNGTEKYLTLEVTRAGIVQIDRNKPSGSREAEENDPHCPSPYTRGTSHSVGAARLQHAAPGKAARRESCKKGEIIPEILTQVRLLSPAQHPAAQRSLPWVRVLKPEVAAGAPRARCWASLPRTR